MTGVKPRLALAAILFFLFVPAFTTFFTNDDFFHLKISQPGQLSSSFTAFTHFRPLTTQVYYFISTFLFSNTPQVLRFISLLFLVIIGVQVHRIANKLGLSSHTAAIASLLYLTSATHYAHLNYSGAFHELGLAVFVLGGLLALWSRPGLSPVFFILALMSKETAIMYPGLLLLLKWYVPKLKISLFSHLAILAIYLVFRFFHFGFATGDSYSWQISPQVFNTLGWYGLWSFNLPEMWVDFIGPGLHLNPNLLKYWKAETLSIAGVSVALLAIWTKKFRPDRIQAFGLIWFVTSLGPLLLLPWHKFAFYLTLPLVGIVLILAQTATKKFTILWILLALLTYNLTLRTHWISQGANTARRWHEFFQTSRGSLAGKTLIFYDTQEDSQLPWSPTQVLKTTLSDQNYFQVYSPNTQAEYLETRPDGINSTQIPISSRQFLGY